MCAGRQKWVEELSRPWREVPDFVRVRTESNHFVKFIAPECCIYATEILAAES